MAQADTSLVWLSQVLMLITTGLQVCQQVKDKVQAFSQDIDFNLRIRRGPFKFLGMSPVAENKPDFL
ncbi:unnamed protein product, partial [Notodromas monacha]